MSWPGEKQRHAMSARGISSRPVQLQTRGQLILWYELSDQQRKMWIRARLAEHDENEIIDFYMRDISQSEMNRWGELYHDPDYWSEQEEYQTRGHDTVTAHTTYSMSEYENMVDEAVEQAKQDLVYEYDNQGTISLQSYYKIFSRLMDIVEQDLQLLEADEQYIEQYAENLYNNYCSLARKLEREGQS